MRLKKIICMVLMAYAVMPVSSFAFYLVDDVGLNLKTAESLKQAYKNYNQLKKQYANMKQRLQVASQIEAEEEGHYGYGNLLNSASDLNKREWSPDNWSDSLRGLSGGNPARYQQLLKQYKKSNPTLSESTYKKGASDANARVYQEQIKTNEAVTVNTTYAFNNIKQQLNNIHQISMQIESTKNEKASTDLSIRMQAEVAYVQVQILKQMALMNEQMARSRADNIASETAAARFNTLPG